MKKFLTILAFLFTFFLLTTSLSCEEKTVVVHREKQPVWRSPPSRRAPMPPPQPARGPMRGGPRGGFHQ
jgi:hypothetical protein